MEERLKKRLTFFTLLLLSTAVRAQIGVVLVGKDHPYYPKDNVTLRHLADSLNTKCSYVDTVLSYSTGKEVLAILQRITNEYGSIGNLVFYGHSGYEGFFVRQNAGFHRDAYYLSQKSKNVFLSKDAALLSDLKRLVEAKKIIFDPKSIVVLAGCNTAYGEDNMAVEFADMLNIPVAGSNQKVDLYNVQDRGEEMRGIESKSFFIYFPLETEIVKYDLKAPTIRITEIFDIASAKRKLLTNSFNYTSCTK